MAPSRWRGREPRQTITYEYETNAWGRRGKLLRAVVERDPEWLESDRAEALAAGVEDAAACRGCGQPTDESMDPAGEGAYTALPYICHACVALEAKSPDYADQRGVYMRVVRREQPAP